MEYIIDLNSIGLQSLDQIGSTSGLKTSWTGNGIRREMAPGTGHTDTHPLKWTHSLG
jgi:DNA transposition AAA+ family ATPase